VENQPTTGVFFVFSWSVEMEGVGEWLGRRGWVLEFIYNLITKKNKPFVRMGTTAHPHPRRCHMLEVGREEIPPDTNDVFKWTRRWCLVGTECSQTRKMCCSSTFFVVG